MTMNPVDPNSTAAKIAARVNTSEAPQDWRLRNGSPAEHRRSELTSALRDLGMQDHVDASTLSRTLSLAPDGDVREVATAIAAEHPGWFEPGARPSASRLVEQFRSGQTRVTPGS